MACGRAGTSLDAPSLCALADIEAHADKKGAPRPIRVFFARDTKLVRLAFMSAAFSKARNPAICPSHRAPSLSSSSTSRLNRHPHSRNDARARRRGDRIGPSFAALHMSQFGTKRTSLCQSVVSAFYPKRTFGLQAKSWRMVAQFTNETLCYGNKLSAHGFVSSSRPNCR